MSNANTIITFHPKPMNSRFVDVEGQTFGRLTVLGYAGGGKWHCQCACGALKTVEGSNVRLGLTRSCGCFHREQASKAKKTHGEGIVKDRTAEYGAYSRAKNRCQNRNNRNYKNYGSRGIEFRFKSYPEFLDHIGRRPSPEYSLDRIDNEGHYEPGNVRWATKQIQSGNTRQNAFITIDGITRHRTEWGRSMSVDGRIIFKRQTLGWCDKCAVTIPSHKGTCSHKVISK